MADLGNQHPSRETLSAYLDGELDLDTRSRVRRHLAECGDCRQVLAGFRATSDFFQALPTRRPPMSLNRDMYRRIDEAKQRRWWLPSGWALPSANALGVAAIALLLAMLAPQVAGIWSARGGQAPQRATQPAVQPAAPPVEAPLVEAPFPTPGVATRTVAGQVSEVNRKQRVIVVSTAPAAPTAAPAAPTAQATQAPARTWQVQFSESTPVEHRSGRKLTFEDVGLADQVEVTGFELPQTPGTIMAASVRVVQSAVPLAPGPIRPKVVVLLDGAESLRAPPYGYTGDWIRRLRETGYEVTPLEPARLAGGSVSLKDFALIVIGYPATLSEAALQAVKQSKTPVLNADPRLVETLGLGTNAAASQPAPGAAGKAVDIAGSAGPLTRGFNGHTVLANDTVYRMPIVSNGTVFGSVMVDGQRRAVWSTTGNVMYFGFWNSATGQNHNSSYWAFFDRSVLLLVGHDPLGPTPAVAGGASPPLRTPVSK